MPHHISFSWQSDTANRVGRSFIETCLGRAIGELQADADVDPADRDMAIDRDTLDVPGMPPIMETIFGKIDRAALFLSDLTYVAERPGGARTPNPNVCIEHGYVRGRLLLFRVADNDELRNFCSPPESWQQLAGRKGVALVRNCLIVSSRSMRFVDQNGESERQVGHERPRGDAA